MRRIDGQPVRGLAEAAAYLQQQDPQEQVPTVVVEQIGNLLRDASVQTASVVLTVQTIRPYLESLIIDTPLAGAEIRQVGYTQLGVLDSYEGLSRLIGQYPLDGKENGAFNVWVARQQGAWVVCYSKVPDGGNLRSRR